MTDLPPPPPALYHVVQGPSRDAATPEPLVLLNGGMMTTFHWEPVAQDLAADHKVVRLDFRGQLMSPGTPPADLAGHAADVVALLDRLGIERAHVAGTSYGALVGLELAARHPERVRSLIAFTATARLSPSMVEGTRRLRTLAQEALAGGDGGAILDAVVPPTYSPEWIAANAEVLPLRRAQVAALPAAWFQGLDGLLAALEKAEPFRVLDRIRCPVAVVAGENDVTFPLPNSEELVRSIPGAALRVVRGAPHGLVLERPAETAALIRELVAGWSATRAAPAEATAGSTSEPARP